MRAHVGITGTPGTGKKTIAPMVASTLRLRCYDINDLARTYGLVSKIESDYVVDPIQLGTRVSARVKDYSLLFGHLLPYAFPSTTFSRVVVLRCDPKVLKRRLYRRGYTREKIAENVEAELIGIISADSARAFGIDRVSEVDTTVDRPGETAEAVCELLASPTRSRSSIDWLVSYRSAAKLRSLLGPRKVSSVLARRP